MYIDTNYLYDVFVVKNYTNKLKKLERKILKFKKEHKFDAIAFTGVSGAAFAFPISASLKIPLVCIRKDKAHNLSKLEGARDINNYIIIDDFIDTGKTINKIINTIAKNESPAKLCAIFLYSDKSRYKNLQDCGYKHLQDNGDIPIIRA